MTFCGSEAMGTNAPASRVSVEIKSFIAPHDERSLLLVVAPAICLTNERTADSSKGCLAARTSARYEPICWASYGSVVNRQAEQERDERQTWILKSTAFETTFVSAWNWGITGAFNAAVDCKSSSTRFTNFLGTMSLRERGLVFSTPDTYRERTFADRV